MNQASLADWAEALGARVAAQFPTYFDDIRQEARIAFWRAQQDFDAQRASPSYGREAFIKQRTRWYLFRALRKYRRWLRHEVCTAIILER